MIAMFRHRNNTQKNQPDLGNYMRPDFKNKTRQRHQRKQTSVKSAPAHSTNFADFFKQNWHIHTVFFLVVVLAVVSFNLLQSSQTSGDDSVTKTTIAADSPSPVEPNSLTPSVVEQPLAAASEPTSVTINAARTNKAIVPQYRPSQWQTVSLALPPSDAAIYQNLLASHNIIDRSRKASTHLATPATSAATPQTQQITDNDTTAESQPLVETIDWQNWRVKRGDTLAAMAKRYGVNAQEIYYLMQSEQAGKVLRKIFPNQIIRVNTSTQGEILNLEYDIEETKRLVVARKPVLADSENPFISQIADNPYEIHTAFAQGNITNSLFLAGKDAGISDRMTMELAGIFGWDIDFVQDIRAGDRFSILYEERHRDGQPLPGHKREGAILAAEFINNGRQLRAIRYTLPDGRTDYFTPEGNSLRKAFIRNPVDVARISSRFNLSRRHPILNTIRAHKGVDYAAPIGTPIRAAGDGKVVFRGTKGGYGKTLILQHGSRYSTLYAHMSQYARSTRNGQRVKQGQIIGYIGKTGLATGPHLHYEFRVNGVHRNPLTVKHPSVSPIPKAHMEQFLASTAAINSQLDIVGKAQYALID